MSGGPRPAGPAPLSAEDARARRALRTRRYRSLPVGWAALVLIALGILIGLGMYLAGINYAAASFAAALGLVGAALGLATWDLFVSLRALRDAPYLALPERITLHLPPRIVPFLTPALFLVGILVGHWYWH